MTDLPIQRGAVDFGTDRALEMPVETLIRKTSNYGGKLLFHKLDTTSVEYGMGSQGLFSSAQLLHIEEEFDPQEIEEMLYVCRDINCYTSIRDLLSDLNEKFLLKPTGLMELFFVVKRFDLVRKYLNMSKPEAENLLKGHRRLLSEFRVLMAEIHEELNESDLASLQFLLKSQLKSGSKARKMTFLSLAIELEKLNLLGPDNLQLLEQNLETIRRVDLRNKLHRKRCPDPETSKGIRIIPLPSYKIQNGAANNFKSAWKQSRTISNPEVKLPIQETMGIHMASGNDERYEARNPGFCLIFDCVGFDAGLLEKTFLNLRFTVQKHMCSNTTDIKKALQDVSKMEQLRLHDIFMCFVISRGNSDSIFGVDEKSPEISLDLIKSYFTGRSCPYLVGKPKLFFFQHYVAQDTAWESASAMVEVDGPSERNLEYDRRKHWRNTLPNDADIFLSHCKVDEKELQKSSHTSLYLESLCRLLSSPERRMNDHLLDIHTKLNYIVSGKEPLYSVQLKHTLTKKLYFPL